MNRRPTPQESLDLLEKDISYFFRTIANEVVIAAEKIEKDASKVRAPKITEEDSSDMSVWTALMIALAVVAIFGILIAFPVFCCMRKRGDDADEIDEAVPKEPVAIVPEQVVVEQQPTAPQSPLPATPSVPPTPPRSPLQPKSPAPGARSPLRPKSPRHSRSPLSKSPAKSPLRQKFSI